MQSIRGNRFGEDYARILDFVTQLVLHKEAHKLLSRNINNCCLSRPRALSVSLGIKVALLPAGRGR